MSKEVSQVGTREVSGNCSDHSCFLMQRLLICWYCASVQTGNSFSCLVALSFSCCMQLLPVGVETRTSRLMSFTFNSRLSFMSASRIKYISTEIRIPLPTPFCSAANQQVQGEVRSGATVASLHLQECSKLEWIKALIPNFKPVTLVMDHWFLSLSGLVQVKACLQPPPLKLLLSPASFCSIFVLPAHYSQIQFVWLLNQASFFLSSGHFRQSSSCCGTTRLQRPPFFYFTSQKLAFFSSGCILELCTWEQNRGAAAVWRAAPFLIDDCWHFLPDSTVCFGASSSICFLLCLCSVVF